MNIPHGDRKRPGEVPFVRIAVKALSVLTILPIFGVEAQACIGVSPGFGEFATYSVEFETSNRERAYGVRLGIGSTSMFGGLSGRLVDLRGTSGIARQFGVDGGWTFNLGRSRAVLVCPGLALSHTNYPTTSQTTSSGPGELGTSLALSLAYAVRRDGRLRLLPFLKASLTHARSLSAGEDASIPLPGTGYAEPTSISDTYGSLIIGLSLPLGHGTLLRSSLSSPVGAKGRSPSIGVGVSIWLGAQSPQH